MGNSQAGTTPTCPGDCTALMKATLQSDLDAVRALLADGADPNLNPNRYGWTALHFAAHMGLDGIVGALLAGGAKTDLETHSGLTALHLAAFVGHVDVTKALLAAGARTDLQNGHGDTPIILATRESHLDVVRMLGGDLRCTPLPGVNLRNRESESALILAVLDNKYDIIVALLAAGADPNVVDHYGYGPLHSAACMGRLDVVEMLLKNGAQVDLVSMDSETGMTLAAWEGDPALVRLLLEAGANPNLRRKNGSVALTDVVGGYMRRWTF